MSDTEALLPYWAWNERCKLFKKKKEKCNAWNVFYIKKKEINTIVRVWHVVGTSKPLFKQ